MTPSFDGTFWNFRTVVAVNRVRVGLAKPAAAFWHLVREICCDSALSEKPQSRAESGAA
jgi:hypothetical protein